MISKIFSISAAIWPLPVATLAAARDSARFGDPTKLICSALIAQAFDAIAIDIAGDRRESVQARKEIYHIRDSSLLSARFRPFSLFRDHQTDD